MVRVRACAGKDNMLQTVLSHPRFTPIIVTLVVLGVFPLVAGYIVLAERKVLADYQVRLGPMRVGPHGLLQPIADVVKLLVKEDIIPTDADKAIFWFAPCISMITGMAGFGVLPFTITISIADVNVGLMLISPMSAAGILWLMMVACPSN